MLALALKQLCGSALFLNAAEAAIAAILPQGVATHEFFKVAIWAVKGTCQVYAWAMSRIEEGWKELAGVTLKEFQW